jgi:hypothetical protein
MIRTVIAGLMSTDNDDHRATGDALREKQNWTLRFDEFERGNKRFGVHGGYRLRLFWTQRLAEDIL